MLNSALRTPCSLRGSARSARSACFSRCSFVSLSVFYSLYPIVMNENKKVSFYRVEFVNAPRNDGQLLFFFGSLAAIYDVFSPEAVGCKIENLWNKNLSAPGADWHGSKCSISCHELIRKKTKRGGHLK